MGNMLACYSAAMLSFTSFFLIVPRFILSNEGLEELTPENSPGICVLHLHLFRQLWSPLSFFLWAAY